MNYRSPVQEIIRGFAELLNELSQTDEMWAQLYAYTYKNKNKSYKENIKDAIKSIQSSMKGCQSNENEKGRCKLYNFYLATNIKR